MSKKITPEEQKNEKAIKETKKSILVEIGERIRKCRDAMKYSQENLANDIDKINIISKTYADLHKNSPAIKVSFSDKMISRYETGAAEMRLIAFINICRGLRRTPNELLKDYISDIEFEQPKILGLYEQLDDRNKILAEHILRLLLSHQNNGRISTLK